MTNAGHKRQHCLRAAFAAAAALAALPVIAQAPPRAASPQQQKQYLDLEKELSGPEAPYFENQKQFDALGPEAYRGANARLDALHPAAPFSTEKTVPDILRPLIAGCTRDGYGVSIALRVTLDASGYLKKPDPAQPQSSQPQSAFKDLDRIDQTLKDAAQDFALHAIAVTDKADIPAPAFQAALDAMAKDNTASLRDRMGLTVRLDATTPIVASTPGCKTEESPATAAPSPPPEPSMAPPAEIKAPAMKIPGVFKPPAP